MDEILEHNTGFSEWLKENAPALAVVAGNLLLMAGEYRVFDFVFSTTGEVWKGLFAVLATFVPFVLWEVAWQHPKGTTFMQALAIGGMFISLLLGAGVGVADFIQVDGRTIDPAFLLGALAISLTVHAVGFLLYFYSHPDIEAERAQAKTEAQIKLAEANAERAQKLLFVSRDVISQRRKLEEEFGADEVKQMLDSLTGKRRTANAQPTRAYAADVKPTELADKSNPT